MAITFKDVQAIRIACLKNADELVRAAKLLLDQNDFDHICYHLATLALEEIGKTTLIQSKYHVEKYKGADEDYDPDTEDHVKKLFWAIWGMSMLQAKIGVEDFEANKGLAKLIHEKRLKYLYVDPENLTTPQDDLTRNDTKILVGLAESRLGYEKCVQIEEPDGPMEEDIKWFLLASDNPEKRPFIFSKESFDKASNLGGIQEWIKWLRAEDERFKKEAQDLLQKELAKASSFGEELGPPKWKVKLRIRSESHTIRNSFFKEWNKYQSSIQLDKAREKNEMVCQFSLPSAVSINDVYDKGWMYAKLFVVALNIGVGGFFWWHVPKDTDHYFDEIKDIATNKRLKFERLPRLKIDLEPEALKEDKILGIWRIMKFLAKIKGTYEEVAMDSYFTGLGLIGKTDIHLQFETNAFERFYVALKSAMFGNGDWDGKEDFQAAIERYISSHGLTAPAEDLEALKRHLRLAEEIEREKKCIPEITLDDVFSMKSLCGIYFGLRAIRVARFPFESEPITK